MGNSGSDVFMGSISDDGTYQSPMQPGQYTIEVRSAEFHPWSPGQLSWSSSRRRRLSIWRLTALV